MTNKSTLHTLFLLLTLQQILGTRKIHVLLFIYCNDKNEINIEMRDRHVENGQSQMMRFAKRRKWLNAEVKNEKEEPTKRKK